MSDYSVAAFYQFADYPEYRQAQDILYDVCHKNQLIGTILLAPEGVNGTVAGSREGVENLLAHLRADARFAGMTAKWSQTDEVPFLRMKIRLKKEIVTLGDQGVQPHVATGQHVDPQRWNDLLDDPDVVLIDTRNHYEVDVGTFPNAIDPRTDSFRDFPAYVQENLADAKDKKIAMFCTGGIRCEKASAYMLEHGFENVYQLQGGILEYLEQVPAARSKWRGECFVFDRRVTVDQELHKGSYSQCHACRRPLTAADTKSSDYEKGVSCPHCINETDAQRRRSFRERQKQVELARRHGKQHIGPASMD
ncbi:MAG: rhodanese-related sulfurtransferase [Gammaproteobacteria bacterium]|nr:rhodanese-related sulfurtransferase [Gammaproteobacteria bacterium]